LINTLRHQHQQQQEEMRRQQQIIRNKRGVVIVPSIAAAGALSAMSGVGGLKKNFLNLIFNLIK